MRVAQGLVGLILISSVAASIGCKKEPPPPPPTVRVENPQLGVAIAALSADFAVTSNEGATIELAPTGEGATGTVSVRAGEPETGGVNLVAAMQQHEAELLERPGGEYKGQTEFGTPMGTTFLSRGRSTGDAGIVEEAVVFMVHPWGDRTLQVIYTYPAGDDTQARVNTLMGGVVGELESFSPAPAEDAATSP